MINANDNYYHLVDFSKVIESTCYFILLKAISSTVWIDIEG